MKPGNKNDIQRMEEELSVSEAKLQMRYSQMGKSLLEMAEDEQKAVDQLVDKIIRLKKQISAAKNERRCPECMVLNSSDNNYCRHCGAKLAEDSGQEKGELT